jgi:hypothetical protein
MREKRSENKFNKFLSLEINWRTPLKKQIPFVYGVLADYYK